MTWIEQVSARTRHSRLYHNTAHPAEFRWVSSQAVLHYPTSSEAAPGEELDMTPERIQNDQLDGWRIRTNDWHFALGQPGNRATDGWVEYGPRQGANWFKSRLARVGYLHWPTRNWQDVGGVPTYDRAKLNQTTEMLTIGPNGDQVAVEHRVTWSQIWATPGDGAVTLDWRASGNRLKETVIINPQAQGWIRNNRPPITPNDETYFGFVFQLDWQSIPQVRHDGVRQNVDLDFDANTGALELQDDLDRQLGYLPLADLYVINTEGEPVHVPLRRRFWRENDNHYMAVGIRVDELVALPFGDLNFDPTVSVSANWDDGFEENDTTFERWWIAIGKNSSGEDRDGAFRFQSVNVPQGAIVTDATLTLTANGTLTETVIATIKGLGEDDAADWSVSRPSQRTKTTATVSWDFPSSMTNNVAYDSPDISTIIEEIVGRAGWQANNNLALVVEDRGSSTGERYIFWDYGEDSSKAAQLAITYSTGSQYILPTGIASAEAFGIASLSGGQSGGSSTCDAPLELLGEADEIQLTVRGHTTQTEPLQTWQDNNSADLAQLTGDGRLRVGDLTMGAANALVEANNDLTLPTSEPKRGLQSLGQITGVISEAIAWTVHELKLLGTSGVSGLHTALRAKLTQGNTGDADTAELRAGDFEVANEGGSSTTPVGQATGVRGEVSNEASAYLDKAVAVEGAIANATGGDITEAAAFEVAAPVNDGTIDTLYGLRVPDLEAGTANYAIHTGTGLVHFGDVVQGFRTAFALKSTAYTLTETDSVIVVDASAGAVTMTLPSAANLDGQSYVIKKVDSSANAVTVAAQSGETIDGSGSQVLSAQWDVLKVISDGINWLVI